MKPFRNPERFWSKVDIRGPHECWPWTAVTLRDGYGAIWHDGNNKRAHRVAYFLTHGELADGLVVMHSCDDPRCVNPAHLSLGTNADNMADRSAKGRHNGAGHCRAKLTEADVRAIIADVRPGPDVAAAYGISKSVVNSIRRGEIWKHVPRAEPGSAARVVQPETRERLSASVKASWAARRDHHRPSHQAGAIRAIGGKR